MSKARATCLVLSALAASACSIDLHGQGALATEELRFEAADGIELVVRSFDGAIDVQSWDANEVAVRIERRASTARAAEALEVRSRQEGNRVVIEAVNPEGSNSPGFEDDRSVSFIVRAPRRITLEAHTTDGAIHASGFEGAIRIDTGDGSIRAERVAGEVRLRSGDGSIVVQDARGALDVETGDGGIDLNGRLESLRVRSGDGSVHVSAADGSFVKSDWRLTTGDGSITLQVPEALDADLVADSNDGRVRADWPDESPARGDDDDGDSYRARLGNGGPAVRLQSGDGSIEIRRR